MFSTSHLWLFAPVEVQAPTLQASPATAQSTGLPAAQAPALQASSAVQPLPSASHGVPSFFGLALQAPSTASHAPVTQAPSSVEQSLGLLPDLQTPPPQTPLPGCWHLSAVSQALVSAAAASFLQLPASQASTVHGLLSSQSLAVVQSHLLVDTHLPPVQTSSVQARPSSQVAASSTAFLQLLLASQVSLVQGLPSLQARSAGVLLQAPVLASQASTVQGTLSSQPLAAPVHLPEEQASLLVQALPSSHLAAFGSKTQPVPAMHASFVQALPSLQSLFLLETQAPASQLDSVEHGSPSSHALP